MFAQPTCRLMSCGYSRRDLRRVRLVVRTQPSQGWCTGSTPVRAARLPDFGLLGTARAFKSDSITQGQSAPNVRSSSNSTQISIKQGLKQHERRKIDEKHSI